MRTSTAQYGVLRYGPRGLGHCMRLRWIDVEFPALRTAIIEVGCMMSSVVVGDTVVNVRELQADAHEGDSIWMCWVGLVSEFRRYFWHTACGLTTRDRTRFKEALVLAGAYSLEARIDAVNWSRNVEGVVAGFRVAASIPLRNIPVVIRLRSWGR